MNDHYCQSSQIIRLTASFSAKPVAPRGKNGTVDKGDVGRVCPQAMAAWEVMGNQNAEEMAQGIVPELTPEQLKQFENPSDLGLPVDPRETEDCLFLDVVTPVATFNQSSAGKSLAPVIFWLPGGGYTAGDKTWENPTGLINASYASSPEGLVFVAPNNRVGNYLSPRILAQRDADNRNTAWCSGVDRRHEA